MKKIVAFDFDGTLTTRDTLLMFILHARGIGAFTRRFPVSFAAYHHDEVEALSQLSGKTESVLLFLQGDDAGDSSICCASGLLILIVTCYDLKV